MESSLLSMNFRDSGVNNADFSFHHVATEQPIDKEEIDRELEKDLDLVKFQNFDDSDVVEKIKRDLWIRDDQGRISVCSNDTSRMIQYITEITELLNYRLAEYFQQEEGVLASVSADDRIPIQLRCLIHAFCGSSRINLMAFDLLDVDVINGCPVDGVLRTRFLTWKGLAYMAKEW